MNVGRVAVLVIVGAGLLGGALMFYLQVWGYYDAVNLGDDPVVIDAPGADAAFAVSSFEGIDADSSPIRYRACFEVDRPEVLRQLAEPAPDAVPLNAPFWFGCFDADLIGGDLAAGRALPIYLRRDVMPGVDRVAALYPDGRAYAWHQLNDLYDDSRRIE